MENETRSFWKCGGYGWLWRVAAHGRLIYMICLHRFDTDMLDGLRGARVTRKILFQDDLFQTRIVFVWPDAEKALIAWARHIRDKALERDAAGFADYCEMVWECL